MPDLIRDLAEQYTIAVVSNTHDPNMVLTMLDQMGIQSAVSAVVLSVEHGWLKPHHSIYAAALDRVGCTAGHAVFVGDSWEADYAGPRRTGMPALFIDPAHAHDIPPRDRLNTVLDIAAANKLTANDRTPAATQKRPSTDSPQSTGSRPWRRMG